MATVKMNQATGTELGEKANKDLRVSEEFNIKED